MELEEIESNYKKELEDAEKELLEGAKNNVRIADLEKAYREKSRIAREKYYKLISKEISASKKTSSKKVLKKEDTVKKFDVDSRSFDIGFFKRMQLRLGLFLFKLRFKTRNSLREKTPRSFSYNYLKFKIKTKRGLGKVKGLFLNLIVSTKDSLVEAFQGMKEVAKKIYEFIAGLPGKVIAKFSKKKEEVKKEEKKET